MDIDFLIRKYGPREMFCDLALNKSLVHRRVSQWGCIGLLPVFNTCIILLSAGQRGRFDRIPTIRKWMSSAIEDIFRSS